MKKDIFLYRYKRRKLKLTFSAPFTLFCESSILSAEFGAVRFEPVLSLDEPGGRITAPPLTTPVLTCCKKCPTLKLRSYFVTIHTDNLQNAAEKKASKRPNNMLLIYQFIFMKICLPHWKNNRPIEKSSLHGLLTFSAWPSHDLGGLTVSTVTRGQGQYFRHGICGFITGFPGPWFVFTFKFSCKRIK